MNSTGVTADQVRKLYWDHGMTQAEVARKLGVSQSTVDRIMRTQGIETRSPRGAQMHRGRARCAPYLQPLLEGATTAYIPEGVYDSLQSARTTAYKWARARDLGVAMRVERDRLRVDVTRRPTACRGMGELIPLHPRRPATRGECMDGPRPCPWVSCRHHLYLNISPATGGIQYAQPGRRPEELERSCALDVADQGGATLEEVSAVMGVTRERVRQLEARALRRLRATTPEDLEGVA